MIFIGPIVTDFALALINMQGQSGSPGWTERIIVYTALALSLANNVLDFRKKRQAAQDELHSSTVKSYENAYKAQSLELSGATVRRDSLQKELDAVSEEYQTLVGIDMKYILDLAREGLHLELARMERENTSLRRQAEWAAQQDPGSEKKNERRK